MVDHFAVPGPPLLPLEWATEVMIIVVFRFRFNLRFDVEDEALEELAAEASADYDGRGRWRETMENVDDNVAH
jgi:hypothetical protein